jgi:hypothetical protein
MTETTCANCGATVEIRNSIAGAWAAVFGIVCDECRRDRWYGDEEREKGAGEYHGAAN